MIGELLETTLCYTRASFMTFFGQVLIEFLFNIIPWVWPFLYWPSFFNKKCYQR
jgi:hypothetical protein